MAKKPTKSKPPVKTTSPKSADAAPLGGALELTPAQAFSHFQADAMAIAVERLTVCRAEPTMVLANLQTGVANITPHFAELKRAMPLLSIADIESLPNLAMGLIYAADRATEQPSTKTDIAAKLARLRYLREPMLMVAEAFVLLDLLPAERVKQIRAGSGMVDSAKDGIALEALYREYATTLAHKHPFTPAMLTEVASLGNWALRNITPTGAPKRVDTAVDEAAQLRDRFWALVNDRFKLLRKAGFYVFGEEVSEKVPLLGSREGVKRPKEEEETPPEGDKTPPSTPPPA